MRKNDSAVSPVVGVMLMLVVTLIIAAVLSGFAGAMVETQNKVPQATIQGEFSVTSGMKIIHAGGDAIPTANMVITVKNGPTFGTNVEAISTNIVDLSTVKNSDGDTIISTNAGGEFDGYNITSFNPGDTFFISIEDCNPQTLQTTVAVFGDTSYRFENGLWEYNSTGKEPMWKLNFVNKDNIGKTFYLDVSDKESGSLISRANVKITG